MHGKSWSWTLALVLSCCLFSGACSTKKSNSPTEPDPIDPVDLVTEFFRGELPPKGRECHDFTIEAVSDTTHEITELEPLTSLTVGMGIGQRAANPTVCSLFAEDRSVRIFELFLSRGLAPGPYCFCIFDVGNIFPGQTVDYAIRSIHP